MTTPLDTLLLIGTLGIPLAALVAKLQVGRWLLVALYVAQLGVLLTIEPGDTTRSAIAFSLVGHPVGWQLDALGWLFAVITIGAAAFSTARPGDRRPVADGLFGARPGPEAPAIGSDLDIRLLGRDR